MRYSIAIAAFAGLAAAAPHYATYPETTPEVPAAVESCSTEVPNYPVATPSPSTSSAPVSSAPSYPVATPSTSSPTPEESTTPCEESSTATPTPEVPVATHSSAPPNYPVGTPSSAPPTPEKSHPPKYPTASESSPSPMHPTVPETSSAPSYPVETPKVPSAETSTPCLSSTTITVTVPYPTGTGYPSKPVTPGSEQSSPVAPYPSVPAGTGGSPAGTGYATKTGGYVKPTSPPEFSGAASSMNVGGFVAGVGAFAAFFL